MMPIERRHLRTLCTHPLRFLRAARARVRTWQKRRWWDAHRGTTASRVIRLFDGSRLRLYADSVLCYQLDCQGFEGVEQQFVRRFLHEGDVFIDAGANIGLFTVLAGRAVGPAGQVHAFEPSPATYQRLVGNVALNKLNTVHCNPLALSADCTPVTMFLSADGHDAWNSPAGPLVSEDYTQQACEAVTLDGYIHEWTLAPLLIKIDVEGWETAVLAGARVTLTADHAPDLLVEFTEENCRAAGTSGRALFQLIREYGYALFHIAPDLSLRPATDEDDFAYCNLFCTKHPNRANQRLSGEGFEI